MDAILVPGGFGKRGTEGKIAAIRYARENGIPYLGICLGMQLAAIEFARNVCGLGGANSTEFDPDTPHPVVALITEWHGPRPAASSGAPTQSDLGGTMRLGAQKCPVEPGTLAHRDLRRDEVNERHRHRYEVNNLYVPQLEAAGLQGLGAHADREPARDDGAAGASVLRRRAVPPGVHLHAARRPSAVHSGFSRCRAATHKAQRRSAARLPACAELRQRSHEALRIRSRP